MNKLKNEQLKNIKGGISGWLVAGLGALVTFLAGILDGIARPGKCN